MHLVGILANSIHRLWELQICIVCLLMAMDGFEDVVDRAVPVLPHCRSWIVFGLEIEWTVMERAAMGLIGYSLIWNLKRIHKQKKPSLAMCASLPRHHHEVEPLLDHANLIHCLLSSTFVKGVSVGGHFSLFIVNTIAIETHQNASLAGDLYICFD